MTIRLISGEELDGCEERPDGTFLSDAGVHDRGDVLCVVAYPARSDGRAVTIPLD